VPVHHAHGADQRAVQRNTVELKPLKTNWRNGTNHIVMLPLQIEQRLAALVPRPCLRLHR
jgi:hypothetical protein